MGKIIKFNIILMILFLIICHLNNMMDNSSFLKINGCYFPLNNILDISMFLIINASLIYNSIYLLNFDFKKTEIFLRIKNFKTWFLAKIYSLVIYNVIFIFITIMIVEIFFIILNQEFIYLSIDMFLILLMKNIIINFIIVILFTRRKNGSSYKKFDKEIR